MVNITIIREMQIKTIMRYHLTPVRMYHQYTNIQQVVVRLWRKGNPFALLVGMQIGAVSLERVWRYLKRSMILKSGNLVLISIIENFFKLVGKMY